jgi:hypothetical protein
MVYKPNQFGIRGLNANIGEWGWGSRERMDSSQLDGGQTQYVILGGISKTDQKEAIPAPIQRYPWEAFETVGFRCVLHIEAKQPQ